MVVLALIVAALSLPAEPDPDRPEPTAEPTPPGTTVTTPEPDLWKQGACQEFSTERDKGAYQAARNSGSARKLRGRVVVLHLRLDAPGVAWSKPTELKVEQAALGAQRFWLEQAGRFHVSDLSVDMVPWTLRATAHLPPVVPDRSQKLDNETQQRVRTETRKAAEAALGETLESVVKRYRKDGYDEVGFVVYYPLATTARPFAWFAVRGDGAIFPDVGYVFAEKPDLATLSVTVAHEGLHLFGADDLYRVRPPDAADRRDLMNDFCKGYRETTLGETTAYAIGWLAAPPKRSYGFADR